MIGIETMIQTKEIRDKNGKQKLTLPLTPPSIIESRSDGLLAEKSKTFFMLSGGTFFLNSWPSRRVIWSKMFTIRKRERMDGNDGCLLTRDNHAHFRRDNSITCESNAEPSRVQHIIVIRPLVILLGRMQHK